MPFRPYIVMVLHNATLELRVSESSDPIHGFAVASVPGSSVSDLPQWMTDAYREIEQVEPDTFLEAQLIASIHKCKRRPEHG